MAELNKEAKDKDIQQIVRYLVTTFNSATSKMERPFRTSKGIANQLYKWQTEFAYRLNDVMQSPRALQQANIGRCNEFIDEAVQILNQLEESKEAKK